jgi:hypothetical protein
MKRNQEQIDLIQTASQQLTYNPLSIRKSDWQHGVSNLHYNPQGWDSQQIRDQVDPYSEVTGLYANIDASSSDNDYSPSTFLKGLSNFTLVGDYKVPMTSSKSDASPQILEGAQSVDNYGSIQGRAIAKNSDSVTIRNGYGEEIGFQASKLNAKNSLAAEIGILSDRPCIENCYAGNIGQCSASPKVYDSVAEGSLAKNTNNADIQNCVGRKILGTSHEAVVQDSLASRIGGEADGVPLHEEMPGRVYAKQCVADEYGANVMVADERSDTSERHSELRHSELNSLLPSKPTDIPAEDNHSWEYKDTSILSKYDL